MIVTENAKVCHVAGARVPPHIHRSTQVIHPVPPPLLRRRRRRSGGGSAVGAGADRGLGFRPSRCTSAARCSSVGLRPVDRDELPPGDAALSAGGGTAAAPRPAAPPCDAALSAGGGTAAAPRPAALPGDAALPAGGGTAAAPRPAAPPGDAAQFTQCHRRS
jgi:hypothetical protein